MTTTSASDGLFAFAEVFTLDPDNTYSVDVGLALRSGIGRVDDIRMVAGGSAVSNPVVVAEPASALLVVSLLAGLCVCRPVRKRLA